MVAVHLNSMTNSSLQAISPLIKFSWPDFPLVYLLDFRKFLTSCSSLASTLPKSFRASS